MPLSRRRLLRAAAAVTGTATGVSSWVLASQHDADRSFQPVEHGFGFRNWSTSTQYFEAPPDPSRASIRERVRTDWRDPARADLGIATQQLPNRLVDAIAAQLRTAVVQRAGTNGHCYGMVLTAQRYFERPGTIPVDRRSASDIEDPTVPIEDPAAPVYEQILDAQAEQFLTFRAWFGRRALLHPEWIDAGAVLADVHAVVDAFGTAALTLFDESFYSHQVLAYGFDAREDGVEVQIYDPNRPAVAYRGGALTLRFGRKDGTFVVDPYGRYTGVLFNRFDRIERATDRGGANPLDHLTVDRGTARSSLFPLALVTIDVDAVDVSIDDPDGEELKRLRGTFMDRTRGEFARVRTRYGAAPGTYRISVFGHDEADYELSVLVCDADGVVVDETRSATIASGATHRYDLEIPEAGTGSIARSGGGMGRSALAGGAGAAGGLAAGAIGYRALTRRRDRRRTE